MHNTYCRTLLPTIKEKYLKRRRPYPTRYALKIRDELRDKMRATIE